jgi:hypothetical protein
MVKAQQTLQFGLFSPNFQEWMHARHGMGAFIDNQTLSLVVMPPGCRTNADFVKIIYEPILRPYLDTHLGTIGWKMEL